MLRCYLFILIRSFFPDDNDAMDIVSEDEDEETLPTRVVSSEVVVNVRAQVETFDFEGLSDMHSIQTLLANIAPRHLILAYGTLKVNHVLDLRLLLSLLQSAVPIWQTS